MYKHNHGIERIQRVPRDVGSEHVEVETVLADVTLRVVGDVLTYVFYILRTRVAEIC